MSPDAGGAERARAYAKRLDAELAIIDKRRSEDGTAEVMNVIGDVAGRTCILQDDIIDTAGTIQKARERVEGRGCRARAGVRGARRAVGTGDRAHREVAARSADRHQHDPAGASAAAGCKKIVVLSVARLLGTGDSEYSRGDVGLFVVCVESGSRSGAAGSWADRRPETEGQRWTRHSTRRSATAEARTRRGASARSGRIPAVVYGARKEGQGARRGSRRGRSEGGAAHPSLRVRRQHADQPQARWQRGTRVMVKDYQLDPVTHQLLHADFYQLAMDKAIVVSVPIVIKGEPEGVKQQGGLLDFVTREIQVQCLPTDIPEHIDVDVSELMLHQSIRVQDLATDPKWKAMTDGETMLVHVVVPKAEEVGDRRRRGGAGAAPARRPSPRSSRRARRREGRGS